MSDLNIKKIIDRRVHNRLVQEYDSEVLVPILMIVGSTILCGQDIYNWTFAPDSVNDWWIVGLGWLFTFATGVVSLRRVFIVQKEVEKEVQQELEGLPTFAIEKTPLLPPNTFLGEELEEKLPAKWFQNPYKNVANGWFHHPSHNQLCNSGQEIQHSLIHLTKMAGKLCCVNV
ncbi:uncharacterized protein LY89DRAFT_665870 [Mollisia scopiformis]|uniref:Uncharacterized protein n=1 Tax=Mollisia scopiformis TaxID=149040 RepID=A0A194XMT7_MOLSC|nr:uncharacterized protein LY89DRAFT_665870 [Mollisia scopiformis]KUJ21441.1 hypothetical protein LY89DRAFT_665870 [Mollisia scopiformis]